MNFGNWLYQVFIFKCHDTLIYSCKLYQKYLKELSVSGEKINIEKYSNIIELSKNEPQFLMAYTKFQMYGENSDQSNFSVKATDIIFEINQLVSKINHKGLCLFFI